MNGFPEISSWSFAKAMQDPVKVRNPRHISAASTAMVKVSTAGALW